MEPTKIRLRDNYKEGEVESKYAEQDTLKKGVN